MTNNKTNKEGRKKGKKKNHWEEWTETDNCTTILEGKRVEKVFFLGSRTRG